MLAEKVYLTSNLTFLGLSKGRIESQWTTLNSIPMTDSISGMLLVSIPPGISILYIEFYSLIIIQ